MSRLSPFGRKMVYLAGIAVLLVVLSSLSQPSSIDPSGRGQNPGGKLSQLRDSYGLSQANLGEIDPASETMRLATLGMRGIAVNILWNKVLHYQKVKDFTSLSATLEQITKLQPNFVRVWVFQGWNLAYNISVEFDDYRDRYYWVIKGIHFIEDGKVYNRDEPTLSREVGRTVSQKMGRSDERAQFRKLFREDDDFHGNRPMGERDSWLVGKEWFRLAEREVEVFGKRMKSGVSAEGGSEGASPLIYLSEAPLCQIYYAAAIEEEGTFDDPAKRAWQEAGSDWKDYGARDIKITGDETVRLDEFEYHEQEIARLNRRLDELAPGAREKLRQEKRDALPEEVKQALATPNPERTGEQLSLALNAEYTLSQDNPLEIASRAEVKNAKEALAAAANLIRAQEKRRQIDTSREIVNYGYWQMRCQIEESDDALAARKLLYQAEQAQREVELEKARELYEQGFAQWRKVLDAHPALLNDGITGADMVDFNDHYRRCLKELDAEYPAEFILADVIKLHEPPLMSREAETAAAKKTAADVAPQE